MLVLLDEVAVKGQMEITKHGCSVARLVPERWAARAQSKIAGIAMSAADDEALMAREATGIWSDDHACRQARHPVVVGRTDRLSQAADSLRADELAVRGHRLARTVLEQLAAQFSTVELTSAIADTAALSVITPWSSGQPGDFTLTTLERVGASDQGSPDPCAIDTDGPGALVLEAAWFRYGAERIQQIIAASCLPACQRILKLSGRAKLSY